jgi:spore maturation protein CgeB
MKRILIVSGLEFIIPLKKTFEALGYTAKVFDYSLVTSPVDQYLFKPANNILRALGLSKNKPIGKLSLFRNERYREDRLRDVIKEFQPTMLFVERGIYLSGDFMAKVKREYNVELTIAWWTKGLQWVDMAIRDAALYDYFFFIHRSFVDECRKAGRDNCFYLPYAVDKEVFRKLELSNRDQDRYSCDIAFVGGWFPNRQEIMQDLMADSGIHLKIWGPKWRRKNLANYKLFQAVSGEGLYGDELVKQYGAARINLNISKWSGSSDSGLNLRIFEIPRCGGFLLTDYIEELEEFYSVGVDIETYRDIDELRDKVKFYLENEGARTRIAARGYEKAMKMAGWTERVKEMMDIIAASSAGSRNA